SRRGQTAAARTPFRRFRCSGYGHRGGPVTAPATPSLRIQGDKNAFAAAALKACLDEPRLQIMPGCGDGMGARLIEEAGFRTGFVSSSSVSAMRLAMPDMDLVTFNEMADAVESCIAAARN